MYIVDRIEEGIAVIFDDNSKKIEINARKINGNVKDGSVVYKLNNTWFVDEAETNKLKAALQNRLNKLFKS